MFKHDDNGDDKGQNVKPIDSIECEEKYNTNTNIILDVYDENETFHSETQNANSRFINPSQEMKITGTKKSVKMQNL